MHCRGWWRIHGCTVWFIILSNSEIYWSFQALKLDECIYRTGLIRNCLKFSLRIWTFNNFTILHYWKRAYSGCFPNLKFHPFLFSRSRTALVTEKMGQMSSNNLSLKDKLKDMETKHRKLLDLSELLQSDLEKKSEAYLIAETQLTSLNDERTKLDQLKTDLACVLQDKVLLEEKLHRHQKALRTLQMVSKCIVIQFFFISFQPWAFIRRFWRKLKISVRFGVHIPYFRE